MPFAMAAQMRRGTCSRLYSHASVDCMPNWLCWTIHKSLDIGVKVTCPHSRLVVIYTSYGANAVVAI